MARTPRETRDDGSIAAGVSSVEAANDSPLLTEGATIAARYQLVRLIARGGMGEVYEAEDLELATRIAIKTIRSERVGDPNANTRLKQEIQAARKITHPNVIRLFDVGFHVLADQRELAFITMELLAGETLEARIRRVGELSVADALPLVRQMAAGLDAAHAAGIVHRDFKSANVIIVDERAIVTDFGLAHPHDRVPSGTTSTDFAGTPAYMAPEQVTRSHKIGPAADVYALGIVMFEMLTGEWPFVRDTALATAAARIEAPAPSVRTLAPDVPAAWERTIARCLERDPQRRFASAGDAVAALDGRGGRRVWLAAAAALLVVAGLAAFAISGLRGGSAPVAITRCAAPELPDIYVDTAAPLGGTGSRTCPLKTITAALAIAAPKRVIHVAAGLYDRAHGEQFPFVLRGEVALIGAGPDRTNVVGVGTYDPRAAAGTASQVMQATIVAGDVSAAIEIAELALAPGVPHIQSDVVGVLCTRGSPERANTALRHVLMGPSYANHVFVGTETVPVATGCNLDLADSRLHEGTTGVWQVGCGNGEGRVGVGLHVHGSTFEAFHGSPAYPGIAIEVWDCARHLAIDGNTFGSSDAAIRIVRHHGEVETERVAIANNRFLSLTRYGIQLTLESIVELHRNLFANVGGDGELRGHSPAIAIVFDPSAVPSVIARDNELYNNDIAIELAGTGPIPAGATLDFGRRDQPGHNTFRCNAAPAGATVTGHDIAVRIAADPHAHLDLAGNRWDHAPPTRASRPPQNGQDILASNLTVDVSDARADTTTCERQP